MPSFLPTCTYAVMLLAPLEETTFPNVNRSSGLVIGQFCALGLVNFFRTHEFSNLTAKYLSMVIGFCVPNKVESGNLGLGRRTSHAATDVGSAPVAAAGAAARTNAFLPHSIELPCHHGQFRLSRNAVKRILQAPIIQSTPKYLYATIFFITAQSFRFTSRNFI